MEITEVRIKLMEESEDRLRGFCSITFDHCFVVRDLKIIQGNSGPFVAMPSRKLTANCRKCGTKNHLRANYCNNCGVKITSQPIMFDATGRAKLYADIAHPVNARCREMIQRRIVEELNREIELAAQPGYKSRYDDDYDDDFEPADFPQTVPLRSDLNQKEQEPASGQDPSLEPESHRNVKTEGTGRFDSAQSSPPGPHNPNDQNHPTQKSSQRSSSDTDSTEDPRSDSEDNFGNDS